jgi:hypothetical protein
VAQIEAEDLQPIGPLLEIRLRCITRRGVAREARGHDQMRAGAQQFEAGLIADLHAAAGQQRHAAGQVRQLRALREIQLRARGAELIVEMMDGLIVLLADVAVPRLRQHARLVRRRFGGRKIIRRREHRLAAQLPDAGRGKHLLGLLRERRLAPPRAGLDQPAPRARIGIRHLPRRVQQPPGFFNGNLREQAAIGIDRFEQFRGRAHPFEERGFCGFWGQCGHRPALV